MTGSCNKKTYFETDRESMKLKMRESGTVKLTSIQSMKLPTKLINKEYPRILWRREN